MTLPLFHYGEFKMKKIFGIGLLAGIISFYGCEGNHTDHHYMEGEVIKESGTLPMLVKSPSSFFNNESVKIGEMSYILTIKTTEGIYTASVEENNYSSDSHKTVEGLESVIETGTRIKFEIGRTEYKIGRDEPTEYKNFDNDKIGTIYAGDITVLGKPDSTGKMPRK